MSGCIDVSCLNMDRVMELEDARDRVLDLHESMDDGELCSHCLDTWGNPQLYPCETVLVLGRV